MPLAYIRKNTSTVVVVAASSHHEEPKCHLNVLLFIRRKSYAIRFSPHRHFAWRRQVGYICIHVFSIYFFGKCLCLKKIMYTYKERWQHVHDINSHLSRTHIHIKKDSHNTSPVEIYIMKNVVQWFQNMFVIYCSTLIRSLSISSWFLFLFLLLIFAIQFLLFFCSL